ncbi:MULTISPECIES: MmgE/PrpD family protein [unclassified Pseudomonas]|uniref:MmgE/PrpD family protein n=1 Tax=unclassified Pseudomonas TaxID=196821 RepID=UPI002448E18A|nr:MULTISPECIES: MmgE/PrpD family protein [unclassified Pseudomonas]MDG9927590.1 MmgE/PrpD family protein [Pseudomonas sp. GD04042]MDH0485339.1 MmgE/PrpD family protein [Pseudomonas sp. GD04015]MDH0603821.1 MmgE/PrpD family protein [Pseudomonas sp. GD03869]
MSEATLARRIARYACGLSFADLPEPVVACVRRRFVDSLACILGAYGARPVEAAIAVAAQAPQPASTVFGTDLRTTPELAAFANGAMVRYLDYNDGYMGREPGHPSDSIPACLALAEAEGASGGELVTAIVVAYEIQMRLQDAASLNKRGWDHVNYINVAMAAAASRLMQLDEARTEQAINIALGAHLALRQVRSGTLSDWKGCSAANAARNALFAASLARHGMTGPAPVFEGEMGFFRQVTGTFELDVEAFGNRQNGDFAILRSLTKTFPTNGELHTAVWAAIDLRGRIADLDAIAAIRIETSEFNRRVLADAEKWRPTTRETADHSLPYNVARALLDGDITLDSYSAERIADPRAIALMDITTVDEDPALTRLFPGHLANRVRVTLADGEELASEVIDGPGSLLRPMGDEDFERKFRRMAAAHIDRPAQDAALAFVAALESRTDYRPLFAAMRPRANPV